MQSGTVSDIDAVVANCRAAVEEARAMAGRRPTATVIGIAGELVKGATSTTTMRRDDPRSPLGEPELERLVTRAQESALREAESRIRWESGMDRLDVRLVHAAIVEMQIDGYPVSNPIGFTGAQVELHLFNAFAPMVHLGALQSVANALSLDLLGVIAEPYAVATCLDPGELGDGGAVFVDIGGGTTDVALVRGGGISGTKMLALGGRAFTKGLSERLGLSFADAEAAKLGVGSDPQPGVAEALLDDARTWRSGVELMIGDLAGGELLPGRILLCGGGADLPQVREVLDEDGWWSRLPFARRPVVRALGPDEVVGLRDATGRLGTRQDVTPMALAHQALILDAGASAVRARDARCRAGAGAVSDTPTLIYLEADDEVTTVVRRLRQAEGERVVLVAPGRSRATSSVVALRLLARVGEEAGVTIAVAGDALTRSLAAEAGLDTYASVEDARNARPAAPADAPTRQASIHVVRGEAASDETAPVPLSAVVAPAAAAPIEEATQQRPVAVVPRHRAGVAAVRGEPSRWPRSWRCSRCSSSAVASWEPSCFRRPRSSSRRAASRSARSITRSRCQTPNGSTGPSRRPRRSLPRARTRSRRRPSGRSSCSTSTRSTVLVEQGTFVAAGEQAFAHGGSRRGPGRPADVRRYGSRPASRRSGSRLRSSARRPTCPPRPSTPSSTKARPRGCAASRTTPSGCVVNPEATAGGVDTTGTEITQADVDTAVAALRADLDGQLAAALGSNSGAVFADAVEAPEPVIQGVDGLVGTRDQPEAQISGTLAYDRLSAERADVVALRGGAAGVGCVGASIGARAAARRDAGHHRGGAAWKVTSSWWRSA